MFTSQKPRRHERERATRANGRPAIGCHWSLSAPLAERGPVASASKRIPPQSVPDLRAERLCSSVTCVCVRVCSRCSSSSATSATSLSSGGGRHKRHQQLDSRAAIWTFDGNEMNEERDQVLANIRNGAYLVCDAKDSSSSSSSSSSGAQWKKFRQVVDRAGRVATTSKSPCGYAVCRQCSEVCPLGRRGGMSALDKHRCHKPKGQHDAPPPSKRSPKPVEKKSDKNQAEKERKEEIAALIKDVACLVLGQESYNKSNFLLQELMKLRLVRACLSEIPFSVLQFVSDGKSPGERSLEFYQQLLSDLGELVTLAVKAEEKAKELQQQHAQHEHQHMEVTPCTDLVVPRQIVSPNLHLRLSYPATGDDNPDITWVSTDIEKGSLGFNRMNVIGRNLSDLIHPDDYSNIKRELLLSGTGSQDTRDFAFPECRVAEPQRRTKSPIEYRLVFLSCTIRPCPRASREREPAFKLADQTCNSANLVVPWKPGAWPRVALFFTLPTHYRYMTLHSLDGCIIQADERITMVTGYSCDEVVGKLAYQYIPESSTFYVAKARERWLESRESAVVSYPLKGKAKDSIIYLRSQGELVEYRDETTGKLMNGFILVNSLIDEQEYLNDMNQFGNEPSASPPPRTHHSNSEYARPALTDSSFSSEPDNSSSLPAISVARHYLPDNYHLSSFSVASSPQILAASPSCVSTYSPVSVDEFTLDESPLQSVAAIESYGRQHYQLYGCDRSPMDEAIFVVDERRAYRDL